MKRFAVAVCACISALAALTIAAPAGAAISPKLSVTPTTGAANLILGGGSTNPAEDAFHKVQIFVPTGVGLKAPAAGASVGTAKGHALVRDVDPTQEQNFTGKITATSVTDPQFAWEQQNCNPTTHAGVWALQVVTNDASPFNVPIFVDRTTGAEAAFGPYKLVICLRPPIVDNSNQQQLAIRSPMGTKIDNFTLTLNGFTNPTKAGTYKWRSLWTPYAANQITPNAAGNVEAQSTVQVPAASLALSAKTKQVGKRTVVVLSGKLLVGGEGAADYRIGFSHGAKKTGLSRFGSAPTSRTGAFAVTSRLTKPTYFQAGVTIPAQELGPQGCTASFGTSVPCVNANLSGARVLSPFLFAR